MTIPVYAFASNYNSNKYIDYVMADKEPVILKR